MKFFTKCLVVVCLFAAGLFVVPGALADDWNKKTIVTFSGPVEVPGVGAQVLPAGTYVFKIMDSQSDRNIVQIFSQDMTHVYTTILAIPNYRYRATDKTVMTFKERAEGEPQAIRAWFYPGQTWGQEFVYPKSKALELAKISNEPVLATPVEIATIDDLKTAPIVAFKPTGDEVPVAEVVQAPPMEVAKSEEPALPATGSNMPLLALAGLVSLGAAVVTKKFAL
jgi:LPXTG-motif cell wall-anchored protein